MPPDAGAKIKSRDEVAAIVRELRAQGRKVGFTSGTFDLLHPGHVRYLEEARRRCDVLVAGINSDASVREYKSKLRPVMPEKDRALVVAGLQAVDYVFIFDEVNNHVNVEVLKPDYYIKAGDYQKAALSSAERVEAGGGTVVIIPFEAGHSTSGLIERIGRISAAQAAESLDLPLPARGPAVFLDRDGTIIEHVDYMHEPEKLRPIPGALEAMRKLRAAGFRLVIVTNQPGIGLGYFTKEDFFRVNLELLRAAGQAGVLIDKIYFCPHGKADGCLCRKPKTGLIERAARELNLDLSKSAVIGDMTIDLVLARNAGCAAVLVKTGYGGKDGLAEAQPDYAAADLSDAAEWVLRRREAGHGG